MAMRLFVSVQAVWRSDDEARLSTLLALSSHELGDVVIFARRAVLLEYGEIVSLLVGDLEDVAHVCCTLPQVRLGVA